MKIRSALYVGSFGHPQPFPPADEPEITFLGRSNVGKSSLINTLLGRRKIARTSNTPGKTRSANFYRINDAFFFVDMPGYGYAKVSKSERARWDRVIADYLESRKTLRGATQILDARHDPSEADRASIEGLKRAQRPFCLVFNKIDKLKRRDVDRLIASHLKGLSAAPDTPVIPFSSETGQGRAELWSWIRERLSV